MIEPHPSNLPKLIEDLKKAAAVAKKRVARVKDGGSCNSDQAVLNFKRFPHPKVRAQIEEACKAAGVSGRWSRHRGVCLKLETGVTGQGCRQTFAAEAMYESLKSDGWDVGVRYYTD